MTKMLIDGELDAAIYWRRHADRSEPQERDPQSGCRGSWNGTASTMSCRSTTWW